MTSSLAINKASRRHVTANFVDGYKGNCGHCVHVLCCVGLCKYHSVRLLTKLLHSFPLCLVLPAVCGDSLHSILHIATSAFNTSRRRTLPGRHFSPLPLVYTSSVCCVVFCCAVCLLSWITWNNNTLQGQCQYLHHLTLAYSFLLTLLDRQVLIFAKHLL